MAVLEAVDFDLKRAFSVLYFVSATSAGIYMAGWLRFNLMELRIAPLSHQSALIVWLSATSGALFALLLPAIAVALGVEHRLQRRMRQLDKSTSVSAKLGSIAVQALPNLHEAPRDLYGQHYDHES